MKRCRHVIAAGVIRDGRMCCSACEWERVGRVERRWRRVVQAGWALLVAFAALGAAGLARELCRALWGWP